MPPHVPRKRRSSRSIEAEPAAKHPGRGVKRVKRESVFDAIETASPPPRGKDQQKFLEQFERSDSDASTLSEAKSSPRDSHDGNQIADPPAKKRKVKENARTAQGGTVDSSESEDAGDADGHEEDDEDGWNSFLAEHDGTMGHEKSNSRVKTDDRIEITIDKAADVRRSDVKGSNEKKGPTKIERQIRNSTHQLHVMSLMYHNHIRNHWINDKQLQDCLVQQLPEGCKDEVDRWRKACGNTMDALSTSPQHDKKSSQGTQGKQSRQNKAQRSKSSKNIRDWGPRSQEAENGVPNLSHGDPTSRLLKALSAFWRKRFNRTKPGTRKHGYKDMERIQEELKAYRENPGNEIRFGERIGSLDALQRLAQQAHGSRDLGAQLFTAMLRGLGMQARMIASLQPAGFGWSKAEEADPLKKHSRSELKAKEEGVEEQAPTTRAGHKPKESLEAKVALNKTQPKRQSKVNARGKKDKPISLTGSDDSDSPLSEPPLTDSESSVVDVTTSRPLPQSHKRFDGDLQYPHYWTEVISPISRTWIAVDPIVLSVVASNPDSHAVFEPRGTGADRTKQVLAYVVAFNPDGSAKDVTTRYLKRHMWPGKTKGVRFPVEKLPLYNKKGKIVRHRHYDWFTDLMKLYAPHEGFHSAVDELEDGRELKPVHVQRNADNTDKEPKESLQYYKQSADFVLKRHLRREEALLPSAEAIKTFRVGKGENATDEPVFKRGDVVTTKSSESWHKEGREVKVGEQPLKRVPMRAVTTIRKAEIEQIERETGQKAQQALFSRDQTEWIIPPPIEGGVIPKNSFGNIDLYVPTMLPKGATHVPMRGTAKICKKLEIDFAEACTGFEFGNRMAVPILTGVVIAEGNRRLVVDAWREEEKIRKEKEKKKQERLALGMWRKMLVGLRVIERVRAEYGVVDERKLHEEMEQESKGKKSRAKKGKTKADAIDLDEEQVSHAQEPNTDFPQASDDMGGGFLPVGMDVEIVDKPLVHQQHQGDVSGGFIVEDDNATPTRAVSTDGRSKPMKSLREQAEQVDESSEHQKHRSESDNESKSEADGIEWTASQDGVMEAKPMNGGVQKQMRSNASMSSKQQSMKTAASGKKRGRPRKRLPSPLTEEENEDEDQYHSQRGPGGESEAEADSDQSDGYEELPAKRKGSSTAMNRSRRRSGRIRGR